jgi:hypothetical protein
MALIGKLSLGSMQRSYGTLLGNPRQRDRCSEAAGGQVGQDDIAAVSTDNRKRCRQPEANPTRRPIARAFEPVERSEHALQSLG